MVLPWRISILRGYLKLRGPMQKSPKFIRLCTFSPHFLSYEGCADQLVADGEWMTLWNNLTYGCYDTLLSRTMTRRFGPIEVNYAVYKCTVDALVEVVFADCQFPAAVVYAFMGL